MQTIIFRLSAAFLFAVVALVTESCSNSNAESNNEKPAPVTQKLPVDVVVLKEMALEQTETIAGSVVPNRSVDVMSELPKKVVSVLFKDGSYVSRGQALYKLDDADTRAKLRQLQADLNLAKINEHRLRELLKTETVRHEEYDIALAKLQSLQAAQDILQVELSKTTIRAPFSGLIGITKVFSGTLVSPGMPLVTLQEQATVKIEFAVSEKYLPLVKQGSVIHFGTEISDEKWKATVVSFEAAVDPQSRNIVVQASAPNLDGRLKPGMSARIYFNTVDQQAKGLLLPTEALIPGGNGYSVFTVRNGAAKMTPVTVANRNEKEALIRAGLSNGDTVMISNILRAADGVPVSIVSTK